MFAFILNKVYKKDVSSCRPNFAICWKISMSSRLSNHSKNLKISPFQTLMTLGVVIVIFEHILHIVMVFSLLILTN